MNLKYYLRGLGIGIIVTALIMGIASSGKKETLSDSEIIERAKALGMTEETTLIADAAGEEPGPDVKEMKESEKASASPKESPREEQKPAAVPQPTEATATPSPAAASQPTATPSPDASVKDTEQAEVATPEPTASAQPVEENSQSENVITIQINNGDGSYSACKQLEEAGLVESASAFDRYLYDNGYDKRINVGTFEIPLDAEPEQIAKILARIK